MPEIDRWQRPEDGFPSDAYFEAVAAALRAAGVHLNDWNREEDWEVNYELADDVVALSPLSWAEHGLCVSWRCGEADEPLVDGFTGLGWYWVPYSKPQAGGDFARRFEINELAEPKDVARAVFRLVKPDSAPYAPGCCEHHTNRANSLPCDGACCQDCPTLGGEVR